MISKENESDDKKKNYQALLKLQEKFEGEKQLFINQQEKLQNNFKESMKTYETQIKELKKRVISL